MGELEHKLPVLKILVVITEQDKAIAVEKLFGETHMNLSFQFRAEGTASNDLLDMLGIGSTGKTVSMCIATCFVIDALMNRLRIKLELILPGRGIAFTIPLSGVTGRISKALHEQADDEMKKHFESEVNKLRINATHDLVLAVINQGYSEELMEAAREAGSSGGTVFHARRISPEESLKFWGITVQREKEVVAIITTSENKVELMKAISAKCGITSKAQGIVLSLPVDSVAGLADVDG